MKITIGQSHTFFGGTVFLAKIAMHKQTGHEATVESHIIYE